MTVRSQCDDRDDTTRPAWPPLLAPQLSAVLHRALAGGLLCGPGDVRSFEMIFVKYNIDTVI